MQERTFRALPLIAAGGDKNEPQGNLLNISSTRITVAYDSFNCIRYLVSMSMYILDQADALL